MKILYLDFEFRGLSEKDLDLVCVSASAFDMGEEKLVRDFWLLNDQREREAARRFFVSMKDRGYIFCSYVVEAEQRSLMSLFGDIGANFWNPSSLKWIDIYLEYRNLLNHNHSFQYGKQYIDGEIITTKPPKSKYDSSDEDDDDNHHKPSYSLAAATFKLLEHQIDTKEKNEVRNLIIYGSADTVEANRDRIMDYCRSDIKYLPSLLRAIIKNISGTHQKDTLKQKLLRRGEYAARSAMMIREGYPVNLDKINSFKKNIPKILRAAQEECNQTLESAFKQNPKTKQFSANEAVIKSWVEAQKRPHWRTTPKGKLSISKDAFGDWYNSESEGFAGAYCRYLKTKQSLNGFMPSSKKKFEDFLGSDGRVRPFMGIYGAQTSRSQPSSAGFIPLKARWMRNLIESKLGYAIVGIDYASQEFLIAAALSGDKKMISAYESGDVYLSFAKDAGLVPKDATKESHKEIRERCKTLVLGISYDMGAKGLASRMEVSEEEATEYIHTFYDTYSDYAEWKGGIQRRYADESHLSLSDGWTLWGDNNNHRSVGNFPVQGCGAEVMREAVRLCQVFGLKVIYTLHDAIYAEIPAHDLKRIEVMKRCLTDAFQNVMRRYGVNSPDIRLEGDVWSPSFKKEDEGKILFDNITQMIEYVDSKGEADLKRYRHFLTSQ